MFKNKSKNEITLIAILCFIILISVIGFIVTSFYKYDLEISKVFYKPHNYWLIKAWSAFTIYNGYSDMLTSICLYIILCLETFVIYISRKKVSRIWINIKNNTIYLYVLLFFIMNFIEIKQLYEMLIMDHGFGKSFDYIILIGKEYIIPIIVFSTLFQNIFYISVAWYIKTKLVKKEDFIERKYWKRSLYIYLEQSQ